MRGVRNKFTCDQVLFLLSSNDVLVVSETHFGIRSKSSKGFYLVVRSDPLHSSTKPRGGVAIYKKITAEIETKPFKVNLPDCCVVSIVNTKMLIIALFNRQLFLLPSSRRVTMQPLKAKLVLLPYGL